MLPPLIMRCSTLARLIILYSDTTELVYCPDPVALRLVEVLGDNPKTLLRYLQKTIEFKKLDFATGIFPSGIEEGDAVCLKGGTRYLGEVVSVFFNRDYHSVSVCVEDDNGKTRVYNLNELGYLLL